MMTRRPPSLVEAHRGVTGRDMNRVPPLTLTPVPPAAAPRDLSPSGGWTAAKTLSHGSTDAARSARGDRIRPAGRKVNELARVGHTVRAYGCKPRGRARTRET